ncbi:MAG: S8 family serine peptidase [Actinomycetes bacterium]
MPAGYATCNALRNTAVTPNSVSYGPAEIQDAYKLPSASRGTGHTVAIVDAFNDPNAESDLQAYRTNYGLPTCTTANGCFKKVNQNGGTSSYPPSDIGWSAEISLDLDAASASCPNCKLLLVEATDNSFTNLETAVNKAAGLGATVISLSWGARGYDPVDATHSPYKHAGVPVFTSTGDNGYGGQYPATSRYVIAVGGTSLTAKPSTTRGWGETVWNDTAGATGSGCSTANPAVAPASYDTGCAGRAEADMSADADPLTGLRIYDTYGYSGWEVFGGTSLSSPLVAGAVALRTNPSQLSTPQQVYSAAGKFFYGVKKGNDGTCSPAQLCTARAGWDGPTGRGTPHFAALP